MEQQTILGTFRRHIAGKDYRPHDVKDGDGLHFVREPQNEYDANAIRIENDECDLVGYIPRTEAKWIAPLLDEDRIQIDGKAILVNFGHRRPQAYAEISVSLLDDSILETTIPQNSQDVSHQMVVQVFKQLDEYEDADLVLEMRNRLRQTLSNPLPETQLLLALFRSKAETIRKKNFKHVSVNLEKALNGIEIGEQIHSNGFSIVPLYNRNLLEKRILLLNQAMEQQVIQVEETSDSGDVQTIVVKNLCDDLILIPEGDIVIGAKQNRVVNITILLAARSRLKIPVSCVEQGRWRFGSSKVFNKAYKAPPSLRGKNMKFVKESRESNRGYEGNQGAVWSEVHYCLESASTLSETDSLTDSYEKNQEMLFQHRQKLERPKDAAGLIFLNHGQPLGLDIYATPEMLELAWERLIDSYVSEALFNRKVDEKRHTVEPVEMLNLLKEQLFPIPETIGLGQRFELEKSQVEGSCLIHGTNLCHSSAFIVN